MSLHITLQAKDFEMNAHNHGESNWLDLTQWSGSWDHEGGRKIESKVSLHFKRQSEVCALIEQLESVLTNWKTSVQPREKDQCNDPA